MTDDDAPHMDDALHMIGNFLAEQAAIESAWRWFRRSKAARIALSEIVARVQAKCPSACPVRKRDREPLVADKVSPDGWKLTKKELSMNDAPTPNLAKIAQTIFDRDASPNESPEDLKKFMTDVMGDLNYEQYSAVIAILDHEHKEKQAEFDRQMKESNPAIEILSGLPKATTFYEACVIKAAQGHTLAQHALRQMNSREYRVHEALFDAAVDVHPGWERGKKRDPCEARAIEDAII